MPGNSQRRGAVRRKGKGNTAGSGGRIRRGLEGRGPTPKAEDRPNHPAHRRARSTGRQPARRPTQRTGRPGAGPEWVAGRNPVLEALQAGMPVKTAYLAEGAERDDRLRDIVGLASTANIAILQVTRAELDRLTGGAIHQGVALQLPDYEYAELDDVLEDAAGVGGIVVALDQITDPRNLGAIIRSAGAFGARGVVIPERRSAQLTAAAWKTSAGAAARVPVARVTNLTRALKQFAEEGFTILGLAGDGAESIDTVDATGPIVIVIGSEGDGLSRLVRETCDVLVSIPISSAIESLNAGVAAGVALYELTRRR